MYNMKITEGLQILQTEGIVIFSLLLWCLCLWICPWASGRLSCVCVCQVFDQYLNFITLEDDMFILCHQNKELISYHGNTCHIFTLFFFIYQNQTNWMWHDQVPVSSCLLSFVPNLSLLCSHQQSRHPGHRHGGHHGHHCWQSLLLLRHSRWASCGSVSTFNACYKWIANE